MHACMQSQVDSKLIIIIIRITQHWFTLHTTVSQSSILVKSEMEKMHVKQHGFN